MPKKQKSSKSTAPGDATLVENAMDVDTTGDIPAPKTSIAPIFTLPERGNESLDRSNKTKRSRKRESNKPEAVGRPADRSWGSEVEDASEDEAREAERKARRLEKRKEARATRAALKLDSTKVKNLAVGDATEGEPEMTPPNAEQSVKKKRSRGKGTSKGEPAKPKVDAPKKVKAELITDHNIEVAASGTAAYIAIDPKYPAKGNIDCWVLATVTALGRSGKTAVSVSALSDAVQTAKSKGKKSPPALIAHFATEEKLQSALGPITILGYATEVSEYRGGKGTVFRVALGSWYHQADQVRKAFEKQAKVKLRGWGWHQDPETGSKMHLMLDSETPPGRSVGRVEMAGWQLACVRVKDGECGCCGGPHNCFSEGVGCEWFVRG